VYLSSFVPQNKKLLPHCCFRVCVHFGVLALVSKVFKVSSNLCSTGMVVNGQVVIHGMYVLPLLRVETSSAFEGLVQFCAEGCNARKSSMSQLLSFFVVTRCW